MYSRHVERALLLQVEQGAPAPVRRQEARDRHAPRRHRRERRRRRHRPGLGRHLQGRVAQPPVATSSPTRARPPASAASCATSSRWAPARSRSWTRCASARPTTPTPSACCPASSPASAATATASACPTSAARSCSTPCYQGNPLVNALCVGMLRHEDIHLASATRRRQPGRAVRRATGGDGIGGASILASRDVRRRRPDQAPRGAGRRPVHGEAAHRVHASRCCTPGSSRASRTSAPPASRARRASSRATARAACTSTSTRCRCATPRSLLRRSS